MIVPNINSTDNVYVITYAPKNIKGGPYEGTGETGKSKVKTLDKAQRYVTRAGARSDAKWLRAWGHKVRVIKLKQKFVEIIKVCDACGYDKHGGSDPYWSPPPSTKNLSQAALRYVESSSKIERKFWKEKLVHEALLFRKMESIVV